MKALTFPSAVTVENAARCHCPCHGNRAPLLTDHVESAFGCDGCRYRHYEAESLEIIGEPATQSIRLGRGWRSGR
jgi:hypothetical protein